MNSTFIRYIIALIRGGKKKDQAGGSTLPEHPSTFITLRDFLMVRFYLRDTPTLLSVILSGKDDASMIYVLNRLISQKMLFDFIHSLTPQFTIWELQEQHSTDTYLIMGTGSALQMIHQFTAAPRLQFPALPDPVYRVWESRFPEKTEHRVYVIGDNDQFLVPCLNDLELLKDSEMTASELVSLITKNAGLLICRKWHLKEMSDATQADPPEIMLN